MKDKTGEIVADIDRQFNLIESAMERNGLTIAVRDGGLCIVLKDDAEKREKKGKDDEE